jgi:UDP-glucose 6-dehydrogenase
VTETTDPHIKGLLAQTAQIQSYDPVANDEARKIFAEPLTLCDDLKLAITEVEAIDRVTRWDEFQEVPKLLAQFI